MSRTLVWACVGAAAVLAVTWAPQGASLAGPVVPRPPADASAVIAAVNSLRIANGLPPYNVNSTLMATAQSQADYMAGSGSISHTGPGGTRPYERALAAGYPLGGQIPPGFFSENIQGGSGLNADAVVQMWTGDEPHMNTMVSPMLQEIGAGVAEAGGMVYYVIDCARPSDSGLPEAYSAGAEAVFNTSNDIIVPVSLSTPNERGEIIHDVQNGQSLWQIAIAYGVKINQIRGLNQLPTAYLINPGDTLLIATVETPTPQPPTAMPTAPAASHTAPQSTQTPTELSTQTPTPSPAAAPDGPVGASGAAAAIIIVSMAAAGLVAWAGRARPV